MASENTTPGLPPKPLSKPLKKPRVAPPIRSVQPNSTAIGSVGRLGNKIVILDAYIYEFCIYRMFTILKVQETYDELGSIV